jgi:hypothetical protein
MSDYVNAGRSKPRRRLVLWPYAAGLVLVVAWAILTLPAFIQGVAPYMTAEGSSSGRMFGYFVGHAFLQALVVWILMNLPFIRWQGPHPLYFVALLAAAAAPEVASIKAAQAKAAEYRYDKAQTQTGKAEIMSVLWSVVKFGPQKDSSLGAQARTAGEADRVEAAWKALAAGLEQDARLFQGHSAALISASGPLAPSNLAGAGLIAAKARVAQAHKAMDQITARTEARSKSYESQVARIAARAEDRARIERLAQKGRETRRHFDELWKVERAILVESEAIVTDPAAARAHRPRIDALTAQEMEMQDDFRRETSSATEEPQDEG